MKYEEESNKFKSDLNDINSMQTTFLMNFLLSSYYYHILASNWTKHAHTLHYMIITILVLILNPRPHFIFICNQYKPSTFGILFWIQDLTY
jgi:hypothetical protein